MEKNKFLSGGKLAGGNPKDGRVKNDYYATNPKAVLALLDNYKFTGLNFLEPCVGEGHISETIKDFYGDGVTVHNLDLVDRGYEDTEVVDFLSYETNALYDNIITNPPYSMAKEFIEKGMQLLNNNGQMAMFLKIQFLEGLKREDMFNNYPPKYIYVFRKRMATWNNGNEFDKDGKRWATTMCHAWFVWEKESKTEPIVRWL